MRESMELNVLITDGDIIASTEEFTHLLFEFFAKTLPIVVRNGNMNTFNRIRVLSIGNSNIHLFPIHLIGFLLRIYCLLICRSNFVILCNEFTNLFCIKRIHNSRTQERSKIFKDRTLYRMIIRIPRKYHRERNCSTTRILFIISSNEILCITTKLIHEILIIVRSNDNETFPWFILHHIGKSKLHHIPMLIPKSEVKEKYIRMNDVALCSTFRITINLINVCTTDIKHIIHDLILRFIGQRHTFTDRRITARLLIDLFDELCIFIIIIRCYTSDLFHYIDVVLICDLNRILLNFFTEKIHVLFNIILNILRTNSFQDIILPKKIQKFMCSKNRRCRSITNLHHHLMRNREDQIENGIILTVIEVNVLQYRKTILGHMVSTHLFNHRSGTVRTNRSSYDICQKIKNITDSFLEYFIRNYIARIFFCKFCNTFFNDICFRILHCILPPKSFICNIYLDVK